MELIPSTNFEATPVRVSSTAHVLYQAATISLVSDGDISRPFADFYIDIGGDSLFHLYKLRVDDSSVVPTPVQVSNLSLPAYANICQFDFGQTNYLDPKTTFVLLNLAGNNNMCGDSDDNYVLIHSADTSSTAPTNVMPASYYFSSLYDSALNVNGLLISDPAAHQVNFYHDNSFLNPTPIITNVNYYMSIRWRYPFYLDPPPANGYDFLSTSNMDGTQSIWRVDSAGNATKTYDGKYNILIDARDADNIFAVDYPGNSGTGTAYVVQQPDDGSAPITLYSFPLPNAVNGNVGAIPDIGNLCVVNSTLYYLVDLLGVQPSTIESVAIGQTSSSSSLLKAYPEKPDIHCVQPAGNYTTGLFVANLDSFDQSQSVRTHTLSSEILMADGTALLPETQNSAAFAVYDADQPVLFQVRDITATDGSHGGGTLYQIDAVTKTAVPFTLSNGDPYLIPSGYTISVGYQTSGIWEAGLSNPSASSAKLVLLDMKNHIIVPL